MRNALLRAYKPKIAMDALGRVCGHVALLLLCCCTMLTMAVNSPAGVVVNKNGAERVLEFRDANYTVWASGNVTYVSSTSYHAKGMAPLYKIANQVLRLFAGENAMPEGYLVVSEQNIQFGPKVENNEWGDLVKHYWAILLVVIVCALIIVLMPIIGFCFCCCRCAGACGGRSQPFDKKHDTCRRVFLGLLLILAATGLIFGVVVAFVTNSYLQQGVENATLSARQGVDDSQRFLKSTSAEANHLLNQNYNELNSHLTYMLKDTANFVIDRLEEKSQAISLTQLALFVNALPQMREDLIRMKEITNGLRVNASQLSDGLRGVKRVLLVSLTKCGLPSCKTILEKYEIGKLDINGIDYNQIPDVSETIEGIQKLITDELIEAIKTGQASLENMRQELDDGISKNIPQVTTAIDEAGQAIREASFDITNTFERISDVAGNNSYKYFDTADHYIKEYSKYNYYLGLALSTTLLVILMCIVLGLLCGICGKRPDGYGDDCCNKGAGSRFLMIGVAVIFLTISVLTACALVYFLAGLVLRRGVCLPLSNPTDDQIFRMIDESIDLNKMLYPQAEQRRLKSKASAIRPLAANRVLEPMRISQLIEACHQNQSIYNVLQLHNHFDITTIQDYPTRYGISRKLDELIAGIQLESGIEILSVKAAEGIDKLAQSELKDFQGYKFLDNLNDNITMYNLNDIADQLKDTADKIMSNSELSDVRTSLKNQALHLKSYQENLVQPMTDGTIEMRRLAQQFDDTLKFNRTNFEEAINELRKEILNAQTFIQDEGTDFVRNVAQQLLTSFMAEINSYLTHVVNKTQNDLGRCGPLSNVYKSLLVAGCNRVVDPFNGFWAGLAWCILIFLPTIIVSVKLSSLYQKSDPYPGPLVESEYMYDAYSERDIIPLANGPKSKRRNKKNERRRSSRDRRGDYYEDSSSPHGPSSGPRDARYNDMAPNFATNGGMDLVHSDQMTDAATSSWSPNRNTRVFSVLPMPPSPNKSREASVSGGVADGNEKSRHWNGGPPRYQNPPMAPPTSEYERPPPYYFPGAPSEPE